MNPRRLYRCRHERQLAGVAAGMAEYLDMDPTVVRILWILSAFLGGFTILLYIILAFVVPLEPATAPAPGTWHERSGEAREPGAGSPPDGNAGTSGWAATPAWPAPGSDLRPEHRGGGRGARALGVLLVVFGSIAMLNVLLPGLAAASLLWPAFVVALGAALLAGSIRRAAGQP